MKTYEIYNINDVGIILDYIHDRYFEIDKVIYEREKQCLRIPITVLGEREFAGRFFFLKRWKLPIYAADLVIYNVFDYDLIDEAKVGRGDINTIVMEEGKLIVRCGLPVIVRAQIAKFHLALIVSDKIAREEQYLLFRAKDYIDHSG